MTQDLWCVPWAELGMSDFLGQWCGEEEEEEGAVLLEWS